MHLSGQWSSYTYRFQNILEIFRCSFNIVTQIRIEKQLWKTNIILALDQINMVFLSVIDEK